MVKIKKNTEFICKSLLIHFILIKGRDISNVISIECLLAVRNIVANLGYLLNVAVLLTKVKLFIMQKV